MSTELSHNSATIIFLHIPKAAGTTLHIIIERQYAPEAVFSNNKVVRRHLGDKWKQTPAIERWALAQDELQKIPEVRRAHFKVIKGHMLFGWHTLLSQPCAYITLLREPVSRMLSLYGYTLQTEGHYLRDEIISDKTMDVASYVSSGLTVWTDNGQTRMLSGVGDSVDFGQCSKDMLEMAKQNIETHFAVVGLSEHFDETLIILKHLFGWHMPFYRSRNVTRQTLKRQAISSYSRGVIEQYNKLDMELYRWASERFVTLLSQQDTTFGRELWIFQRLNGLYGRATGLAHWIKARILGKR